MVDPIALVEKIIEAVVFIHDIVEEVRSFSDLAKKLDYKIQLLKPPLDCLLKMKSEKQKLTEASSSEGPLDLFGPALCQMLFCIEKVRYFIDVLQQMNFKQKTFEKKFIKDTFDNLCWELDELQKSIQFSVLTEVRHELEKKKEANLVSSLVRHASRKGTFSSTSRNSIFESTPREKRLSLGRTMERFLMKPTGKSGEISSTSADSSQENTDTTKEKPFSLEINNLPVIYLKDMNLIQILGEGSVGLVWLANHKHGEEVAVKIFDVGNYQVVLKEASKMQRAINCQYIVRLRGIVNESNCHAIVMDYFKHGSLKSFMKYLDCDCWARRMRMLCDVAVGLNYLHNLTPPIVHKDIKACNIFVDHGLMAKLGDLGISSSGTKNNRPLPPNVIVGTVSHMPPEAWAGTSKQLPTPWDIYAFGITLYEFTSGESPWPLHATDSAIRGWVYTDGKRPDDFSPIKPSTPDDVNELMLKCWQEEPEARPSSQDIQALLMTLFDQEYQSGIRKADQAIRERMTLINDEVSEQ